jgi:imidazolonepropionase-like amidohydrolase
MRVSISLFLFALIALSLPLSAGEPDLVIKNARVFDGERWSGDTVIVHSGTIVAVGKGLEAPAGATVVDAKGRALLPGLIDAHTHVKKVVELEQCAVFGVTTALDQWTEVPLMRAAQRGQLAGEARGRRAWLFSASCLVTTPGGHGTEYGREIPTLTRPDQAEAFVAARLREGADWIKAVYDDGSAYGIAWKTLDAATLRAVAQAAHKRRKLLVVHVSSQANALAAIDAGADGLVHVFGDSPPQEDLGQRFKAAGAFVVPTLTVIESVEGKASGAGLAQDPGLAPYLSPVAAARLKGAYPRLGKMKLRLAHAQAAVKALHIAGVPILAGTDVPNPGTAYGVSIHRELELLVASGLTPTEALRSATSIPATCFRLSDRGRIAPGKRADLVLVDGDPGQNIAATRKVVGVWVGGKEVDRAAFAKRVAALRAKSLLPKSRVSDFETDTHAEFGLGWSVSTDKLYGGESEAATARVAGGALQSKGALEIKGEVKGQSPFPWSGALFSPGPVLLGPADLRAGEGITFWAKGDGQTYAVAVFSQKRGTLPAMKSFAAGKAWKSYSFKWAEFHSDGSDVTAVLFAAVRHGPFSFRIDAVRLIPKSK